MTHSHVRGHKVYYIPEQIIWKYLDNNEIVDLDNERSCKKCKCYPTPKGYDACLGYLPNVDHACCGHGVEPEYKSSKGKREVLLCKN